MSSSWEGGRGLAGDSPCAGDRGSGENQQRLTCRGAAFLPGSVLNVLALTVLVYPRNLTRKMPPRPI